MSKLLKLKEWIALTDAAKYLSVIFQEEINQADILSFALDGHLILSINFVNYTVARSGNIIYSDQRENVNNKDNFQKSGIFLTSTKKHLDNDKTLFVYQDRPESIKGLWDIPMIGGEKRRVEQQYQALVGGPAVKNYHCDYCLVKDVMNGTIYMLQAWDGGDRVMNDSEFYGATEFPKDSIMVVRTAALRDFEQFLAESNKQNTGNTKDSTRRIENLLRALTAIAIDAYGYVPESERSNAPQDIVDVMSNWGVNFDARTVRKWLKEGAALMPAKITKN